MDALFNKETLLVLVLAIFSIAGVNQLVAIDYQAFANAIVTIILSVYGIVKSREVVAAKAEAESLRTMLSIKNS